MATKQTDKMVAWLDEERRKDKALIIKLEERAAGQSALIDDQARRIHSLEGQIEAVKVTNLTTANFDETISRLRTELTAAIDQVRTNAVDQEMRKAREIDREGTTKAITLIREEVLDRVDRELQLRKAEEERLSRIALELQEYADNLSKSFEEFERSLNFLEEQRRQDTRRLSDINGEIADVRKRGEGVQAKTTLLEDISRRNERLVGEVSLMLTEFKQEQQTQIEQSSLIGQERERTLNDMIKRIDTFGDDMVAFEKQFGNWTDTFRVIKKYVDDFDRLADRMDRRLNEVAEVQRLSEERFRQGWEDFAQDQQKSWRQFTISNDEAWRENEKTVEKSSESVVLLAEKQELTSAKLKILIEVQQDALRNIGSHFQAVREQLDDGLKR